jgi:hypothetical protein
VHTLFSPQGAGYAPLRHESKAKKKDYEKAIVDLSRVLPIFISIAVTLIKKLVKKDFEKALELEPNNENALEGLREVNE